jgi:hypothetical protein
MQPQSVLYRFVLFATPLVLLPAGFVAFNKSGWEGVGSSRGSVLVIVLYFVVINFLLISKYISPHAKIFLLSFFPLLAIILGLFKNPTGLLGAILLFLIIMNLGSIFASILRIKLPMASLFTIGFIVLINVLLIYGLLFQNSTKIRIVLILNLITCLVWILRTYSDFWKRFCSSLTGISTEYSNLQLVTLGTLLNFISLGLVYSSVPDAGYDSLWLKVTMSKIWSENLDFLPLLDHPNSGAIGGASMVATFNHLIGISTSGAYFQTLSLALILFTLFRLVSKVKGNDPWHKVILVGATSVPAIYFQTSMAYDELVISAVMVGFTEILLKTKEDFSRRSVFLLGVALASVSLAKLFLIPLAFLMLIHILPKLLHGARAFVHFSVVLLLGFSAAFPLWLHRLNEIGNPFFPFGNSVFGLRYPDFGTNLPFGNHSFIDRIALPITSLWNPGLFDENSMPGVYGIIMFSILLSIGLMFFSELRLVSVALLIFYFLWLWQATYLRYLIPLLFVIMYLLLAIYRVEGVPISKALSKRAFQSQKVAFILVQATIIGFIPLVVASFWQIPERFPIKYLFSQQTSSEWYQEGRPVFALANWANKNLPMGATITDYTSGNFYMWAILRKDLSPSFNWEVQGGYANRGTYSVAVLSEVENLKKLFGDRLFSKKLIEYGEWGLFQVIAE